MPSNVVPISICGKAPDWYTGLQYKKLAPKYQFFMEWKRTHDNAYYVEHFEQEVLVQLNADTVFKELSALSGGQTLYLDGGIVLLRDRHIASGYFDINYCPICGRRVSKETDT